MTKMQSVSKSVSKSVTIGDTIHCNRCDKPFASTASMTRDMFCGQKTSRIKEFATCPHCQQTDAHWIYAADLMPEFEGNFEQRRKATRRWLNKN